MKRSCILYSFIGLFLFFCACGNSENIPDTDSEDAIDFETTYREEKTNNVIEEAWKKGTEQTDNTTMLMVDYISNVFTEYTEGQSYNVGYFSDYKYIYALNECFPKNENKWFYSLDIFDVDTMKASGNIIKDVEGILINPYAIAGRVFASNIKSDPDGILTNYSVIELQPDGTVNEFTDTFDILMENEWIPEPHVVPMTELKYEPASGYTYILSEKRDQLIVIDQDGTRIEEFTGFIDGKTRMSFYSYSQDGYLIFLAVEKGEEKFFIYKNKRFETVYAGEMGNEADESYQVIDGHGRILFLQNNSEIVSWDTKSGQQDIIYKSGTSNSYYSGIYAFARNEKGELLIFSKNNIKVLSYAGTGKSVEITVKPLLYTSNYLKQCINRYMETHPGVIINLLPDTEWDARDIELNKVYSEITNEEGPDLLLVWDDQLVNLEKSNCLYDLSEVLKPEVEASLVPAVRDAGKIDNKKYEMVTQPEIKTFFINRKYCDGDTWTINKGLFSNNSEDWLTGTVIIGLSSKPQLVNQ